MTPTHPSRTAEAVCWMRAIDRVGPHASRIVDDPYAQWFLSPVGRAGLALMGTSDNTLGLRPNFVPGLTHYVQLRHRWMDDQLLAALPDVDQVLVLGAGYDMRAYRFAGQLGKRPVFEVDYPSTAARKARILAAHRAELPEVDVRVATIDFQTQRLGDVLAHAGFDTSLRTFVFWEGVSMYLNREAIDGTLTTLRALGATHLVMDFWTADAGRGMSAAYHRYAPYALRLISEPLTFSLTPKDAPALMAAVGWEVTEIAEVEQLAARYHPRGNAYPGTWCVAARSTRT